MNYSPHLKVLLLCFILLLQRNVLSYAQKSSFVQLHTEPEFSIASGERQYISLFFSIEEGYHIQANQVKDDNLIPTALFIDTTDAMVPGKPVYPEAIEFNMKGKEEALQVYSNVLEIKIPVRGSKSAKEKTYLLHGRLYYQACDDSKCYFPRDLDFIIKINLQ